MEEEMLMNYQQLKEFVQKHKLKNSHSIIQFNSIVTIKTEKHKITNQNMRIMVTFEGYENYGRLTLLKSDLDPYLFPTEFEAKWQQMRHVDNEYLEISGVHTQNHDIGKYQIKIIPLDRLYD